MSQKSLFYSLLFTVRIACSPVIVPSMIVATVVVASFDINLVVLLVVTVTMVRHHYMCHVAVAVAPVAVPVPSSVLPPASSSEHFLQDQVEAHPERGHAKHDFAVHLGHRAVLPLAEAAHGFHPWVGACVCVIGG